jgi:hypothetical protein
MGGFECLTLSVSDTFVLCALASVRSAAGRCLRPRAGSVVRELFETLEAAYADGRAGFARAS